MSWPGCGTWMLCEEHGTPYPRGAECPKCAAQPVQIFLKAKQKYEEAEEKMVESFTEWKHLVREFRFNEAKESLRPMPECASKVLIFREIILAEENYDKENTKN